MCESGVVQGLTYIAEHMDVRERRCTGTYVYRDKIAESDEAANAVPLAPFRVTL